MQQSVRAPQEILYSIADGTGAHRASSTPTSSRAACAPRPPTRAATTCWPTPRRRDRKEGRFYPIEVKLKRRGVRARYRRGYEWLSEAKRCRARARRRAALPGLYAEDGLALDPWIEGDTLNVAVILPTRALAFRNEGALYRNELRASGPAARRAADGPWATATCFTKTSR